MTDPEALFLIFAVSQRLIHEFREEDLVEELSSISQKLKAAGADVDEAFSIIAEHEERKLRWIKCDFSRFLSMVLDFSKYVEDA